MSDLLRGKKIIAQRIEYPLPKKTGVRDYVFHFVPRSDGYGAGAHSFFGKYYPHHVSVEVTSLEALITTLHTAVTGREGVQQIREIVMVSHGNAHGLLLKVLKTVTSANQEFKYLTGTSLALLRKDFLDGKLPTFASQRQVVITHLSTASWVTVRACNFGKSREGLYALYSFFGGKPNVYAPMEYQFFGSQPILEGARLPSKLKVHQHMVRQRFLPADVHTPERQDAIVRALIDPGQFTAPFDIASRLLSGGPAEEAQRYEDLVSSLNAGRANAFLKTKFTEQALPLSARANLLVKVRDAAWIIKDVLQHNNAPFAVEYQIDEEIIHTGSANQPTAILRGSAKLAEVRSAQDFIPLQLFFYAQENEQWRAKLFTLAFFTEEPNADPANQTRFNATVALLNAAQLNNGAGLDLRAVFHEEGFDLSQAAIGPSTTTGTGTAQRVVWPIQNQGTNYLVKLEHPATANGIPSHTLTVYLNPTRKERLLREYDLMATLGSDPDSPGTELPAYFDTFTLDELTGVIDHLRTPYKPGNSYYLHHAQQALQRKKEYFSWWQQRHPDMANQVLIQDPYLELSGFEREERRGVAYEFDFSKFWAEVKASSPSATAFQQDLFLEESLATVLGIPPDVIANRAAPPDMETDSPYTDIEELRALERTGVERFFTEDKFTFEPPPPNDGGITCEEFGAVIAKWKELQGRDTAEIEAELGLLKTADGKTYLQWAMQIWDWSFPVRAGLALNNMSLLKDGFLVKVVARIPGVVTLSAGGLVSSSTLLALLRVWPVVGIPLRMWKEFLNEQVKTDQMWETIGHVTAMRQWLRRLEMITFEREDDFPEVLPPINVSTTTSVHPYYLARYYEEQVAEYGRYFVFFHAPERMQKGYDEGVRVMDAAAEDIMEKAEESISTVLAEHQLDACKIKVLTDAGLLDVKKLRARAVREIARVLLDKIPGV